MRRRTIQQAVVCMGAMVAICAPVMGDVSFTFSLGSLEAKATFAAVVDGPDTFFEVTLENISASDVRVPSDVLTGVFFDLAGDPTLTPVRAILTVGSVVHFPEVLPGGIDSNGEVGGEYAYLFGAAGLPADNMISAVGLGDIIGPGDLFPGESLWDPNSPDGLGYGITSAVDDPNTGNAKVKGKVPLVQDGVVFRLTGLPVGYDVDGSVSNVWFNYGTDLTVFPGGPDDPNVGEPPPFIIPLPAAVWGGMMLLGGMFVAPRLRRRLRSE